MILEKTLEKVPDHVPSKFRKFVRISGKSRKYFLGEQIPSSERSSRDSGSCSAIFMDLFLEKLQERHCDVARKMAENTGNHPPWPYDISYF